MSVHATANQELIPGYVALERLGAGGYGEVWKVDAPGGLKKAVKVIYGYLTEERATRELKALHNIKLVRHPFLLSLERIEVVDGRLMIVTELADMSLVDRFEQCRQTNLTGVPRDELLGYLRDAADALDYMLQTHSLQHLDVKPENLLLTAGRAKVADFGLVKEIADKTHSLVGAMTPTYAAPEVFAGKASRFSDQYSLAIVYQEMLTGTLPFPGRTAAQLAAQHAHNRPQLSALSAQDREICARALAKRPPDRFATCREFVDALASVQLTGTSAARRASSDREAPGTRAVQLDDTRSATGPPQRTEIVSPVSGSGLYDTRDPRSSRRPSTAYDIPVVKVARASTDLSPPAVVASEATLRPAMFVGVGQTGMLALEKLYSRLSERLGDAVAREAYPMLVVETDSAALKRSSARRFDGQNILHVPLRLAHEYRDSSEQLLAWLGRRWLYNIPKSGETLGMRPWGRLAIVDHAAAVVSKLRPRLASLANGAARNALSQVEPQHVRSAPARVYIVGSCCGGTGGGALLELAYAVRNITRRLSATDVEICAIITTSTNQCPTQAQLATANAVSFLTELQHYARCGGEGAHGADPKAAIYENPDFPLTHAYLVDLGSDLTQEAFDDGVATLADYLYCDVATPLGSVLDACRTPQADDELQIDLKLRSFRLARFDGLGPEVLSSLINLLAYAAATLWLNDLGGGKQVAERYLPQDDTASSATPDYALRSMLTTTAMSWYGALEARLFPPPDRLPNDKYQARLQAARGEFLKQLLAVRQANLKMPNAPELASLLRRVTEQGRDDRITAYVDAVAHQALHKFVEAMASPMGAALLDTLLAEAHDQAFALFCELTPDTELAEDGTIRASSRPALAYLRERAQASFPLGCGRRTFLLSPPGWLTSEAAQQLDRTRQMHLEGPDAHTYVCEELEGVSLGQLVESLASGHCQIMDVVDHLHTRVDICWSDPARTEPLEF